MAILDFFKKEENDEVLSTNNIKLKNLFCFYANLCSSFCVCIMWMTISRNCIVFSANAKITCNWYFMNAHNTQDLKNREPFCVTT